MPGRVLVVSPRFWPEDVKANDVCRSLNRKGWNVDCICGQPNYPLGRFFKGYGSFGHKIEKHGKTHIYRTAEARRGAGSGFQVMMNYLVFACLSKGKARRMKRRKYDAVLVYQNAPVSAISAGAKVARAQNIPLLTFVIDLWPDSFYREMDMHSPLLRKITARISRKNYMKSDKLFVLNQDTYDYFTKELQVAQHRVDVLPLGPSGACVSDKCGIDIRERFTGGFNIVIYDEALRRQDLKTLVDMAVMIRSAALGDIRIVLVCGGADTTELLKQISKKGIGDILFVESLEDYGRHGEYCVVADAFLSCEKTDSGDRYSSPEDIIDYMSSGLPVILAGDGEGKRLVRESKCGFTCDPEDAQGLFDAVVRLYGTPRQMRIQMSRGGLEYQQRYFNWDDIADRIIGEMEGTPGDGDGFVVTSDQTVKTDDIFTDDSFEETDSAGIVPEEEPD